MRHARFLGYMAFATALLALPRWLDPWGKTLAFGLGLLFLVALACRRDPLEEVPGLAKAAVGFAAFGALIVFAVAGGAYMYRAYVGADEVLRSVPSWVKAVVFSLSGFGVIAALHETGRGISTAVRSRSIIRALHSIFPAAAAAVLVAVAGFSGRAVLVASSAAALSVFFVLWSLSVFGERFRGRLQFARERVRAAVEALRGRPATTAPTAWSGVGAGSSPPSGPEGFSPGAWGDASRSGRPPSPTPPRPEGPPARAWPDAGRSDRPPLRRIML